MIFMDPKEVLASRGIEVISKYDKGLVLKLHVDSQVKLSLTHEQIDAIHDVSLQERGGLMENRPGYSNHSGKPVQECMFCGIIRGTEFYVGMGDDTVTPPCSCGRENAFHEYYIYMRDPDWTS